MGMKTLTLVMLASVIPSICSASVVTECRGLGDGLSVLVSETSTGLVATVTYVTKRTFDFPIALTAQAAGQAGREYVGIANAQDDITLLIDGRNSQVYMPELQTDEQIVCN
jgi:hypothetical protein